VNYLKERRLGIQKVKIRTLKPVSDVNFDPQFSLQSPSARNGEKLNPD
jgi:hypothetical protein